MLKMNQGYWGR